MSRYGLIGEKLTHSFSKPIHEALSDINYQLIELNKHQFNQFFLEKEFEAINVTIPYKEQVIPYLYFQDSLSKRIGSVNTIINQNGKLYGYNTDYFGFKYMLEVNQIDIEAKKVIVLGTGGTSKTVKVVLEDLNAETITIVSRTKTKDTITYDELDLVHDFDILINTTPVGMSPDNSNSPISLDHFKNLEAVVDVIFNPLNTKLLVDSKIREIRTVNGLLMLVEQARKAHELFLDHQLDKRRTLDIYNTIKKDLTNVVLIGMPASGKSTIGKALATKLNKTFIDIDVEIEKHEQQPIPSIFKDYGEDYFRKIESLITKSISSKQGFVISTGGGIIKNVDNMKHLMQNGLIIFLDRDIDKMKLDDNRPLSKNKEELLTLYEKRLSLYQKYADNVVKNNSSINECINKILEII